METNKPHQIQQRRNVCGDQQVDAGTRARVGHVKIIIIPEVFLINLSKYFITPVNPLEISPS